MKIDFRFFEDEEPAPPKKEFIGWYPRSHLMVPDLIDVYYPGGDAFRWFTLENGSGCWDMELVDAAEETVGELDSRIESEVEQMGWEDLLDIDNWHQTDEYRGRSWRSGKMHWALEHGLAPGQPFLVRFGKPEYSAPSYYDGEVDVTYDVEFVRALPLDPLVASERWLLCLEQWIEDRDASIAADAHWAHRHQTEVEWMRLHCQTYGGGYGLGSIGVRYSIVSEITADDGYLHRQTLLCESSDRGDNTEAKAKLFEKAKAELGFTREQFDALKPSRFW